MYTRICGMRKRKDGKVKRNAFGSAVHVGSRFPPSSHAASSPPLPCSSAKGEDATAQPLRCAGGEKPYRGARGLPVHSVSGMRGGAPR